MLENPGTISLIPDQRQRISRIQYLNVPPGMQDQQITVAGSDDIGFSRQHRGNHRIVINIPDRAPDGIPARIPGTG